MGGELKSVAAGGNTIIKTDGKDFILFVGGNEVDKSADYNAVAKLATDIYVAKAASNDDMIGRKMFAPSSVDPSSLVVVVAKSPNGYVVQKSGSTQRFEVESEFLSEAPVNYFQ